MMYPFFPICQGTFWTQASQVLGHPARLWILLIKCRQHMPISCYIPGKVEVNVEEETKSSNHALDLIKCFFSVFFRRRSTFDSLCLGARTSTLPQPTKTWPTPLMCISIARENLTMLCEFRQHIITLRPGDSFSEMQTTTTKVAT